jgi:hypothetical protein
LPPVVNPNLSKWMAKNHRARKAPSIISPSKIVSVFFALPGAPLCLLLWVEVPSLRLKAFIRLSLTILSIILVVYGSGSGALRN